MKTGQSIPVALTVAGSDSGGGAGIQADLKTFHALGVFGTSAVTCITAQNPRRVSGIQAIRARLVAAQIERVLEAFPVTAAKTGMLYNAAIIEAVTDAFRKWRFRKLVVDPVLVASSGALLLQPDALAALKTRLLPQAALVTPNLAEAGILSGRPLRSVPELRDAARALAETYGVPFLVKGGHLAGSQPAVDVLFDGTDLQEFRAPRVAHIKTHGTGCTYSAAITAHLARGLELAEAVHRAKTLITRAIRQAIRVGRFQALKV